MTEVLFNGHAGRIEGRYHQSSRPGAPIALILHPHPQYGGTMSNKVVYALFSCFKDLGFSVLRFNFRGVGRSQGQFEDGPGELSDATVALDWLQSVNPEARQCWIAGYSFAGKRKGLFFSGAVSDFGPDRAGRTGRDRYPFRGCGFG